MTSPFAGMGTQRWCALCGCHRPYSNGSIRLVLGSRNWVCSKHNKGEKKNAQA